MLKNTSIEFPEIHSIEQPLKHPALNKAGIELIVKREDLLHPLVSGNKWRKLKYNILEIKRNHYKGLFTFGGAFSNHLYATAAAGKIANIPTIGFIRGEETLPLNSTLEFAKSCGMQLNYLDRNSYRNRNEIAFIEEIEKLLPGFYHIPEGGSNTLGVKGCEEIISDIHSDFDIIVCAVGSGGTIAGIISGLKGTNTVLGFSSLKGVGILDEAILSLIPGKEKHLDSWSVNYDYHFGGYAKINEDLIKFIVNFEQQFQIALEPIYTGKMFYGLFDLIEKGYFKPGTRILAIHTGGLQGRAGLEKFLKKSI